MPDLDLRDHIALTMPDVAMPTFGTAANIALYVGGPMPQTELELIETSLKAMAKYRYAYADAMLEARKA